MAVTMELSVIGRNKKVDARHPPVELLCGQNVTIIMATVAMPISTVTVR